jgi:hypothetical protein
VAETGCHSTRDWDGSTFLRGLQSTAETAPRSEADEHGPPAYEKVTVFYAWQSDTPERFNR